jgi:serine/threonine protein kinase
MNQAVPSYDALLAMPEARVFKDDARSRVWLVQSAGGGSGGGGYVVKRFEHAALKQKLVRRVGLHPAQREVSWNRRLRDAGLPVVPIAAHGVDAQGRSWLVTPEAGTSLYHWVMHAPCAEMWAAEGYLAQRRDLTSQLAVMVGHLLRLRLEHRDFKASNLILDPRGRLHMIDVGAVRGAKGTPLLALALRMLTTLHANVQDAASHHATPSLVRVTRAERLRFLRLLEATFPKPVDGFQHLPRSGEFGG